MEQHTPKFRRTVRWNAWLFLLRLKLRFENRRDPFLIYIRKLPKAEKRKRFKAGFAQLAALTRMVFVAHRLDGLDYRAIAEQSGASVREIERELARALVAVHDAFWKQYTEDCAIGR